MAATPPGDLQHRTDGLVNTTDRPRPSLVAAPAVERMPRWALLLLCAAWALPGWWGRDPWRGADVTAYAVMAGMAQGRLSWWEPTVGGQLIDLALIPHWLGALSILALSPWVDAASAARLPFAVLLVATTGLVWYAAYHLAREPAAQPLPSAFGNDPSPRDYARALADGATLAWIATLGLLDLGHQTIPELVQLFSTALLLWSMASVASSPRRAAVGSAVALCLLSASGGPALALCWGLALAGVCRIAEEAALRRLFAPLIAATAVSSMAGLGMDEWQWRLQVPGSAADLVALFRLWGWYLWPTWPLVLWTVWQWRRQWRCTHLLVPTTMGLVALLACAAMGRSDRTLLLALPATALLAAFALPTLKRGTIAAIDWFSMTLFSLTALFIWIMYLAMQTGFPTKPAANVAKLAPSFSASLDMVGLAIAAIATGAWLALVRWRTGRHRPMLWKGLVLPAGGITLCWMLLMTLWMPLIDHDRSPRPIVAEIVGRVSPQACVQAPDTPTWLVAALESMGSVRVEAGRDTRSLCPWLLTSSRQGVHPAVDGWTHVATVIRPTDRRDQIAIHRRVGPTAPNALQPAPPAPGPGPRP